MTTDADTLFEMLVDRIDKPHEYSRLIARLLGQVLNQAAQQNIVVFEGVPYTYDSVRAKFLSLTRPTIQVSSYGPTVSNRCLSLGDVPTGGQQGFYVPRNATVTALWAKSRSTAPWTFEVRKNGVNLTVASANIVVGQGAEPNVNVDVDEGDWLQFFVAGTNVGFPIATCELAWRKL